MRSDAGIRCYGPGFLRKRGRNIAAMFGMSWSKGPLPNRTAHEQLAYLAKGNSRLVFSEENFVETLSDKDGRVSLPIYPLAIERVTELVAAWAPIKPQLFLAVRNPATFLASAYSQVLFGSVYIEPRQYRARNDWRKIDWADYITKLRTITGVSDIYVWRQEDYDLTHRLILRRMLRWQAGGRIERSKAASIKACRRTPFAKRLRGRKTARLASSPRNRANCFRSAPTIKFSGFMRQKHWCGRGRFTMHKWRKSKQWTGSQSYSRQSASRKG
ncbi:hypothetical protein [Octadecabacter arcticus]|nr:hypothetical protein [Octadecabacter arcticus]